MNSLFKKFLLYNIISLGLIAGIVSFTLQASQKNLIDEKVQQVSSHSSLVDKYLSQYSHNKNINEFMNKNELAFNKVDQYKIDGDFVESQAFAYLAIRSYLNLPISFPNTTRCDKPTTGGKIIKNF